MVTENGNRQIPGVFQNFTTVYRLNPRTWLAVKGKRNNDPIIHIGLAWAGFELTHHRQCRLLFVVNFLIQLKFNFWHYQWFLRMFDTFYRENTAFVTSSFLKLVANVVTKYFPFKNAKLKLKTRLNKLYIALRVYYYISFVMWLW